MGRNEITAEEDGNRKKDVMAEERRTHWVEAGEAGFLYVMADQIVAVVYWQGPQSTEVGGEAMEVPGERTPSTA